MNQVSRQRGKFVIVPKADLISCDRVILIDNRNHPQRQECVEGAARILIVGAPQDILGREEDLADNVAKFSELPGVFGNQQTLPNACSRRPASFTMRPAASTSAVSAARYGSIREKDFSTDADTKLQ